MSRLRFLAAAGFLGLSACASYAPQPISPADNAALLQQRRLDDPRLRAFLDASAAATDDASASDTPTGWDLTTLTRAALYFHPDLDLARSRLALARAAVLTARQPPNPQLSLSGSYALQGTPLIIGGLIDFVLETFGKRDARTSAAEALADAARFDLASAEWLVRGRVRTALIDVWAGDRKAAALGVRIRLQRHLVAMVERRQVAGDGSSLDVGRERIVLAGLEANARDVARLQADARARLAAAIGIPVDALDGIALDFGAVERPAIPERATLTEKGRAAIDARADVTAAQANYDAAEAALRLQIANQYPNLGIGGGYTSDQGVDKPSGALTITLPLRNRNEGPIAEARARREQAAATLTTTQAGIIAALDAGTAALRASTASLASADALAAEQATRQAQLDRSFAAGAIDRLTLVGGELEGAVIAASRIDLLVTQRQALGLIEDAVQQPLFGVSTLSNVETNPRANSPSMDTH